MYEYSYVFDHCSDDLPMKYIFSAFWEGQEGSFLLWMFWHSILGFVVLKTGKKWESSVMMFVGIIEAIIASMLLGVYVELGDWIYKMGSNPTLLVRDIFDAPIFQQADYLSSLKGDGLNPLLQNYWMTIHPPTLFLGFAACTFPAAYAAAGFYTKDFKGWLTPGLKWGLFAGGILGIGILMGAAWAYEALTFGGYWAWDPVENMSLVPWIVMVAAIHTNLIAKSTGRAIKSTFIYYSLSFILILYSTYLTRSGILGDTSAHAFTEMGLEPQLIFMVAFSALVPIILYILRAGKVEVHKTEESIYSREFWMFVGALVLLFSGLIIAASTSLPVMNAIISIFNPEFEGTVIKDPIPHFNKFQIWVSVLVTILSAKTIHLRYKTKEWNTNQKKSFVIKTLTYAAIAGVLTFVTSLFIDFYHWKYVLLTACAFFTIIANSHYLVSSIGRNLKMAGSVVSHLGFAIMIIGTIASGLNEYTITNMPFAMRELVKEDNLKTVVNLIKNEKLFTKGYWLTYEGDTIIDKTRTFDIKFERENPTTKVIEETFHVYPNVLFSNDMTKVAATNPDTKHYIEKDIFVTVASLPASQIDIELAKEEEDSLKYIQYNLSVGDTIFTKDKFGILEYLTFDPKNEDFLKSESDLGLGLGIRFYDLDKEFNELIEPIVALKENLLYQYPGQINALGLKVKLNDKTFDNFFTPEDELQYEKFNVKQNKSFDYGDLKITLLGFDSEISNPNYKKEEDDIAIKGLIKVEGDGFTHVLNPIYVIRNSRPFSIKDYLPSVGLHLRLSQIDPQTETFTMQLAMDERTSQEVIIDVAEDVTRTDFLGLEAKVFPGINMFWVGASMMMMGMLLAFFYRIKQKYA